MAHTPAPGLYRLTWSHACGVYWMFCRAVTLETGESWKRIFETDDPGALYRVSDLPPPLEGVDPAQARHPAPLI